MIFYEQLIKFTFDKSKIRKEFLLKPKQYILEITPSNFYHNHYM